MPTITPKSFIRTAALASAVPLALVGAAAVASIPSSNGTIHGCYARTDGATRIINSATQKCAGSEKAINWSQRGPVGPRGPRGLPGADGEPGEDGAPGAAGISGYEQVQSITDDVPLPIDTSYLVHCPSGKKVLGGGVFVQLYSDTGFVGVGQAPLASQPAADDVWDGYVHQPVERGATKATITVSAVCAVVAP